MLLTIIKLLLFVAVAFRVFIAISVETALVFDWPVADLDTQAKTVCPSKPYPDWCLASCQFRSKAMMDTKDLLAIDPVFSAMIADPAKAKVNGVILIVFSAVCLLAYIGLLLGTSWGKTFSYVFIGAWIYAMGTYMGENYLKAFSQLKVIALYNIVDLLLPWLFLIVCWCTTRTSATSEQKPNKKKTK